MTDKIIHFKVDPLKDNVETINRFWEVIKNYLGDEYKIIVTPFDATKIDGDFKIINLDFKEYSYNELMDVIEKASIYDNLCR